MARLAFEPVYPLWGTDTRELAQAFVRDGYRGVTVCVDAANLGAEWANRDMDAAFFAALPAEVDPCGEHGEFHSFVHDGPGFAYPVRFERRRGSRGGFHYGHSRRFGRRCARCGAAFECGMKAASSAAGARPPAGRSTRPRRCFCPRCLRGWLARARAPGCGP
jgi:hypothetical protein